MPVGGVEHISQQTCVHSMTHITYW